MNTLLVSAVLAVVACSNNNPELPDARTSSTIDARASAHIDATRLDATHLDATLPQDAIRNSDDAVVNDASSSMIDAATHSVDAAVHLADAAQLDAARIIPDASTPDASPSDAALAPLLAYASTATVFKVGSSATTVSPSIYNLEGSSVISCGIKSGTSALPSGLHVDNTLCTISGTPISAVKAITYTVELVTTSGTVDATVTLSVHIAIAIQIGGAGSATNVMTTVFDADSNVVVAGTYTAALTTGITLPITGTQDLFLAKFTDTGTLVWQKHFGSAGKAAAAMVAVTDASNNVTVLAVYKGSVDAGNGNAVAAIGTNAMFLARYSSDGTFVWSRFFNGSAANLSMGSLNVDSAGDVAVVIGWSAGTVDFGGGAITEGTGFADALIAKYNGGDGSFVWEKNINTNGRAEVGSQGAGDGPGEGPALAFDSNNNLVIEFYQNAGTWDYGDINGVANSGNVTNDSGNNSYAVVLVKFGSSDGATIWTRLLEAANTGTEGLWGGPIAIDSSDNVVGEFYFSGPTIIGAPSNITPEAADDSAVIEYDTNGAFRWVVDLGSSSSIEVNAITVEADDQILLASYVSGSATVGGETLTSAGATDAVNLRYASDGTFVSANTYGGSGAELEMAIDSNGISAVAGMTFASSGISVSSSAATFSPVGSNDSLIFSNP